jgi:hypothetical protein
MEGTFDGILVGTFDGTEEIVIFEGAALGLFVGFVEGK